MDLSTTYLGLSLSHPVIPGASSLTEGPDRVRRLEDAGAPAVVLPSLFEEEIEHERLRRIRDVERPSESFAEALSYFPRAGSEGPDAYLERLRKIKEAVAIPVIASLNGASPGTWVEYARQIQEAGADALELNVYFLAADPGVGPAEVDDRVVEVVGSVVRVVSLPVAVKLSPFFSSLPHLVRRLGQTGARAVVLFNRFYQPDIDPEALEVVPRLRRSTPAELGLRLRWTALLAHRVPAELAVTGGVHGPEDAAKAILAGARTVQMVSALLEHGPDHLGAVVRGLTEWMERKGYENLDQVRGLLASDGSSDPAGLVRANYARVLRCGV
ncbi:dihydroorotate dehydrogenase-like protein [Deferrisoma camini]|uniref:dihydroorotate dehydrogenase-like protein n=1 Tax=Deferrisoma camini TaxID=1035120 RepID=UPI00046D5A5D|nr:dihydroorotate dehydrogenase-like protein [Deferrisoma camini]